jgi:putative membrane protein
MNIYVRLTLGALIIALVLWLQGDPHALWYALAQVGPQAIVIAMICHTISMSVCGVAWWVTAGSPPDLSARFFVLTRWIRDGIGQLLPFVPLGGEVTGARILARAGLGGSQSAAITVVDITAELMTQALFSLIGAVIWVFQDTSLTYAAISLALILPMAAALYVAQKMGLVRLLENLADKVMPDAWKSDEVSDSIHTIIHQLYQNRRRFLLSSSIHLTAWLLAITESYFVLNLLNHPITLPQSLALESVIFAIRSAAFMVPGALGIQEGAYVLVGAALGLPSEAALALALVKRARELALGLPALVAWQWVK